MKDKITRAAKLLLLAGGLGCALAMCRVPSKYVIGSYRNNNGDSLSLTPDHFFWVEVKEPDSTINLSRISTGRWYRTRRKLFLTMDSRSMGEYWSCAPFSIRLNILRRSDTCAGSKHMLFNRIVLPKHLLKKKNANVSERNAAYR